MSSFLIVKWLWRDFKSVHMVQKVLMYIQCCSSHSWFMWHPLNLQQHCCSLSDVLGCLGWLKGFWPSTNGKNMPWHTQAFLGHSEPFSCLRTVTTLTTKLNTIKTCVSCGMVWQKEERLHSTLSAAAFSLCLHFPWPSMPLPVSSPHLSSRNFPSVSLCLFHLLLFYSSDSWLMPISHVCS